ncbi:hypothetical protein BSKO_00924 [Bryopsis sp. KO-2023]|nr:hypothetical protein BSKO_00924 [Bryopsis sp. KO-2023]
MADVTRESKLKNIKARHQQWMQQRDAEKDRMNVMQEMQEVNVDSGKDQTVEMVDKLTQRITDRLRVEIRNELQSASTTQQLPNKEASIQDKLESFLVQEIQSQTCPICYELMASPERAPILLFPCGTPPIFSISCQI